MKKHVAGYNMFKISMLPYLVKGSCPRAGLWGFKAKVIYHSCAVPAQGSYLTSLPPFPHLKLENHFIEFTHRDIVRIK